MIQRIKNSLMIATAAGLLFLLMIPMMLALLSVGLVVMLLAFLLYVAIRTGKG